jgi:hypothetical protein
LVVTIAQSCLEPAAGNLRAIAVRSALSGEQVGLGPSSVRLRLLGVGHAHDPLRFGLVNRVVVGYWTVHVFCTESAT